MVLRGDNLHNRLTELLETHTHFDIATAWVWGGEHLELLEAESTRRDLEVRAIVGIAGNATHPDALDKLNSITHGELRIVPTGDRLFHPKLYLFGRHRDGIMTRQAWIGSANFTKAGFGGHSKANEEIIVEIGPGKTVDDLAAWFKKEWGRYATDQPIADVIGRYKEDWKPPHREVRAFVSGPIRRMELLGDRPQTFDHYHQALKTCEEMLLNRNWDVFNPQRRSYMAAIRRRRAILLGDAPWSGLGSESRQKLTGGLQGADSEWWGLLGQMNRGWTWRAVCNDYTKIRRILERVKVASDGEFPGVAVRAMKELKRIKHVKHGTATLLLTLARPDRLLSVNTPSEKALEELSGSEDSALREPEGYGNLLQWLYDQPWYGDGPPVDEDLMAIWRFRAALVDAFVYEPSMRSRSH